MRNQNFELQQDGWLKEKMVLLYCLDLSCTWLRIELNFF